MSDQVDLDSLRRVVDGMTAGEWASRDGEVLQAREGVLVQVVAECRTCCNQRADADGIAALRNAAPALLRELADLRRRVGR